MQDADGSLWICSGKGLWVQKHGEWKQVVTLDPSRRPTADHLFRTKDGQLWVAMSQDDASAPVQWQLVNDALVPFRIPEVPAVSRLRLEDREGNLWFGGPLGLDELRPKYLQMISTADGLASDEITTLDRGADGKIWVGTGRGIGSIREGQVLNAPLPRLSAQYTTATVKLVDSRSRVWSAWHGDLAYILSGGHWEEYRRSQFPRGISAAFEDKAGRFWLAANDRLFVDDHGFLSANGPPIRAVYLIFQDRQGEMWIGAKTGLGHLHNGNMTWYTTKLGDYNNRAWCIHEDADGIFWLGSQNGLNRFVPPGIIDPFQANRPDEERFFTFNKAHGLHDEVINNVQEDHFGNLWLSGLRGVFRVSRHELNEVVLGVRSTVHVLALGEADGMLSSECNGGDVQPSGATDEQGRIWFPTAQGVVVIDPERILTNSVPPGVLIQEVKADDEVLLGDRVPLNPPSVPVVRLAPGRGRVLALRYTATSFVAPERIRFKFQLIGYDPEWRDAASGERVAYYTNLRPGDYKFRVKACNNHGIWNETGASFAFDIAPKFTQTLWFPALSALALLAVSGAFGAWRLRWQHRVLQAEKVASLERERARIAKDLHDDLGANLTGIGLQAALAETRLIDTAALKPQLTIIGQSARRLVDQMREVIWAINPECDTVESFCAFLSEYAERYLNAADIRLRLDFPQSPIPVTLASEVRHQLFLITKEAIANVVKHARASEVWLRLAVAPRHLTLAIRDNGKGFSLPGPEASAETTGRPARATGGHGLPNMRHRASQLGARVEFKTDLGLGTEITIIVPLDRSSRMPNNVGDYAACARSSGERKR